MFFILIFILIISVGGACACAALILTYAAFTDKLGSNNKVLGIKTTNFYLTVGGFVGYYIFFLFLIEAMLFFLPKDWGSYDEDGYFIHANTQIAIYLSCAICLFIFIKHKRAIKYVRFIILYSKIRIYIRTVNEIGKSLDYKSYKIIKKTIFDTLLTDRITKIKGSLPCLQRKDQWAYTMILNASLKVLLSGKYHIFNGELDSYDMGKDILKLYDDSIDKLLELGEIDFAKAHNKKEKIRILIKKVRI